MYPIPCYLNGDQVTTLDWHNVPMTDRPGLTFDEIAERYGRTHATIVKTWRKNPLWPKRPVGKRGKYLEWDPEAIARVAEYEMPPKVKPGDDDAYVTDREVCEMFDPPIRPGTLRSYKSRGQWIKPDAEKSAELGADVYRRGDARKAIEQRKRKRAGNR